MYSFKRFGEEKLPDRECFYSSVKDRTTEKLVIMAKSNEDF